MRYLLMLLLPLGLVASPQPQKSVIFEDHVQWTFTDKQGDPIIFEWCGTSTLESVRSIYLDAYIHEDLYRAFLDVPDAEEAKVQLNASWDFRKAAYQTKLESNPPKAYFAIAKKDSKIIGFVIFDTDELGTSTDSSSSTNRSFPPEKVFISPIMILPEAQGMGLGKELVFSILKRFPNLKKISLATTKTMPASEFYKHLGFQEIKNEGKQDQIDDPKLRETVTFFEWINPDA